MRLETDRLMIRSIERGDGVIFSDMAKDGSLLDVGFNVDCSEWMSEWIDEAIRLDKTDNPQKDYIAYTVCIKDSGIVIGSVGCSYYEDLKETGVTYFVGQKYRGNGYAAESVQAYSDYFFPIIQSGSSLQRSEKIISRHGKQSKKHPISWMNV